MEEEVRNLLTNPIKKRRKGSAVISTTINLELHKRAIDNNIQWSEALRRGITQILAEKDDPLFMNPIQMQRRIESLATQLSEVSQNYNEAMEKIKGMRR